jgi:signal transduction histidine kinase
MKLGIGARVNLSIFLCTTFTTILLSFYFYTNLVSNNNLQIKSTIEYVIKLIPLYLNKEYILKLTKDSHKSPDYYTEWLKINHISRVFNINIYILMKDINNNYIFIYDALDNPLIKVDIINNKKYISSENWVEPSKRISMVQNESEDDNFFKKYKKPPLEFEKAYTSDSLEIAEEYTDEYGTYKSGFKSLQINDTNKVIIGVDYEISSIKLKEIFILKLTLFIIFFTLILNIIISKYLNNIVTRPIINLSNHSQEIKKGNYDSINNLSSYNLENEIGELYESYRTMVSTLINNYQKIESTSLELKNLSNIKDQFLANLSHELNTPLTVILSYSELINMDGYEISKIKEFSNEINIAGHKLKSYLEDLLMVTMIESKIDIEKTEVNLNHLINELLANNSSIKNMNLNLVIDLSVSTIFVDRGLFKKALNSILSNSILYNKQNGSIIITSRRIDDSTVINIQDTGIGIPEDKIDFIFEKFFRVDSTYTYEVSGVGLGLFITKNILDLHGIGYSVKSKLGNGTDFKIMI